MLVLSALTSYHSAAQNAVFEWVKGVGSGGTDHGNAVAVDGSGNVYVTGYFSGSADFDPGAGTVMLTSAGDRDAFLAKYTPNGNCLWAIGIGGSSTDYGQSVAVDGSGNVYVTGYFNGPADFDPGTGTATLTGSGDVFLAKYAQSGSYLWAISMGSSNFIDVGAGVAVDGNGDVYVAGNFFSGPADFDPGTGTAMLTSQGGRDAFLAKYASNGSYLWAIGIGSSFDDFAHGVTVDGTGNVYIAGEFNGSPDFDPGTGTATVNTVSGQDIFLAKYDHNGNYLWAKGMGSNGADKGTSVAVDGNDNVYLTGNFGLFGGAANFNPGGTGGVLANAGGFISDVFLAKYDSSGNYVWAKRIGANSIEESQSVKIDGSGNVYITGSFTTSVDFDPGAGTVTLTADGGSDAFVAAYDPGGNYIWAKRMGGGSEDQGNGVAVDVYGNVYATGYFAGSANFNPGGQAATLTSAGDADIFLVRISQGCKILTHLTESACDSFDFNGIMYTVSGAYADTFTSYANCDSIVTLDLTIGYTSGNPVVSGHYCDSITFNGVTYNSSGIYTQRYANAAGCDSNIVYDLTIGTTNGSHLMQTACDSFVFNDTLVYTVTGNYLITFANSTGCDSAVMLHLTIVDAPKASVVLLETTLTAGLAETYQWVNCDNDFAWVAGATEQRFTPDVSGNYAVVIKANGCSDTSECTNVQVQAGINELQPGNKVRVYPNPVNSRVTIQTEQPLKHATIRLVSLLGGLLEEQVNQHGSQFILDVTPYASGIYFLDISDGGKKLRFKMVKE